MSFRDVTLNAIGNWIVEATGLTADKVQRASQNAGEPRLPFLTMRLQGYDRPLGTDEVIPVLQGDGTYTEVTRGWRAGELILSGFGEGAEEYLIELIASAKRSTTIERFLAAGLSIRDYGTLFEVGAQTGGGTELQFSRTLAIEYGIEVSSGVEVVPAERFSVVIRYSLYEDDPSPWVQTIAGNLT